MNPDNKEKPWFALVAAAVLCLACGVVVAGAAVVLKPMQERNAVLKKKRNVLEAAGLYDARDPEKALTNDQIEETFKSVKTVAVRLEDGTLDNTIDVATYDSEKAAKSADSRAVIGGSQPLSGFVYREDTALAYLVMGDGGKFDKVILPVYGKGLWSTLKGFIALDSDLKTISGLTFYSHAETPGLGGEVDNPKWKSQWKGKIAFDESGEPEVQVVKGGANPKMENYDSSVDGLSGATITANGVQNLVNYWLSEDAFGPFLDRLEAGDVDLTTSESAASESDVTADAA